MKAWHVGRTFYACVCGARDERTTEHADHPPSIDCWQCGLPGGMKQWVPPAVARDRAEASAALSARGEGVTK